MLPDMPSEKRLEAARDIPRAFFALVSQWDEELPSTMILDKCGAIMEGDPANGDIMVTFDYSRYIGEHARYFYVVRNLLSSCSLQHIEDAQASGVPASMRTIAAHLIEDEHQLQAYLANRPVHLTAGQRAKFAGARELVNAQYRAYGDSIGIRVEADEPLALDSDQRAQYLDMILRTLIGIHAAYPKADDFIGHYSQFQRISDSASLMAYGYSAWAAQLYHCGIQHSYLDCLMTAERLRHEALRCQGTERSAYLMARAASLIPDPEALD